MRLVEHLLVFFVILILLVLGFVHVDERIRRARNATGRTRIFIITFVVFAHVLLRLLLGRAGRRILVLGIGVHRGRAASSAHRAGGRSPPASACQICCYPFSPRSF